MKEEITYQWKCQQFTAGRGKWFTTRFHCTEQQIRIEHPEAVPIESTKIVRMVPSTHEEVLTAKTGNSMGRLNTTIKGP